MNYVNYPVVVLKKNFFSFNIHKQKETKLSMSKNLKAMVMAAGMGSRLEPITLSMPKPLIPIMNTPLMDIILSDLRKIGVKDVISNTYYFADKIIDRYKKNNLGINFNYIKEDALSGTAGGLKKCQHFFDEGEDFIVISGDILTNADIQKGIEIHKRTKAIATIGVKEIPHEDVPNFGVVVTDKSGYIKTFQEKPSLDEAKSNMINTGIYIFNYKIFDYIPENTFYDFARDVFPKLLKEKEINTFKVDGYWSDVGTISQYKQAIQDVFKGLCEIRDYKVHETNLGNYVVGNSKIPNKIRFMGNSVIGDDCKLGEYIMLDNCIVFDGAEIKSGSEYVNQIILPSNDKTISHKKAKEKTLLVV